MSKSQEYYQKHKEEINTRSRKYRQKRKDERNKKIIYCTFDHR